MNGIRLRRIARGAVASAFLAGLLPGSVTAAAITKFSDHYAMAFCEGQGDGGYVSGWLSSSRYFGDDAGADAWLDPAVPFDDPQSATGSTTSVGLVEAAGEVTLSANLELTDGDGNPVGTGTWVATMGPDGDPRSLTPPIKSNHHYASTGTIQTLTGTATLAWGGHSLTVECGGERGDVTISEANPTSYVDSISGVRIDCTWVTDDAVAGFYAYRDEGGFLAGAFLESLDLQLNQSGPESGSLDAAALSATVPLEDGGTGDPYTATASATFALLGDPVTSIIVRQNGRSKVVEQALDPSGTVAFSSGDSFQIDGDHCVAALFARHSIFTAPNGPKAGQPASNDAPSGAIPVKVGARLNALTTGTVNDAEVPIETCPEGFRDDLGHTLWYTFVGTGGDVTLDTSGSNFDTVIAAYTQDAGSFSEVGCEDDVVFQPIGASYQAVLTIPTTQGVTYFVQAGGFRLFGNEAEQGRLRLAIR